MSSVGCRGPSQAAAQSNGAIASPKEGVATSLPPDVASERPAASAPAAPSAPPVRILEQLKLKPPKPPWAKAAAPAPSEASSNEP